MFWKLTLLFNVLLYFIFWLIAQVAIEPAHNYFIQYAPTGYSLVLRKYSYFLKSLINLYTPAKLESL